MSGGVQAALDAEAIGLGENFSTMEGETAYYSNPAGISLRDNIFSYKANFGLSVWNNIFDNSEFTEDEIERKLSSEDLILAGRSAAANQIYFKNFAFGVNGRAEGMMKTNSDLVEIVTGDEPELQLLQGENRIDVPFTGTNGGASTALDLSLSYARPLPERFVDRFNENRDNRIDGIYIGGTYHYLQGDVYQFTGEGSITAEKNSTDLDGDGQPDYVKYTADGTPGIFSYRTEDGDAEGHSVDLGFLVKMEEKYSFGLSVMNIGEMSADSGIVDGYEYEVIDNGAGLKENKKEEDAYNKEISWKLPRIIRIGGSMRQSEKVKFYGDYSNIKYDSGEKDDVYAVGTELTFSRKFPVRFGLNYSTLRKDTELSFGIGINLHNFTLDFGAADIGALFDESRSVKTGFSSTVAF